VGLGGSKLVVWRRATTTWGAFSVSIAFPASPPLALTRSCHAALGAPLPKKYAEPIVGFQLGVQNETVESGFPVSADESLSPGPDFL
jgi:hypothetical protein